MKKILIANWKMNPRSEAEALALAKASDGANVVVCPPFPFLSSVGKILKKAAVGAQDVFWESRGAFTGEVSVEELMSFGVSHVIVGHSERRRILHETDDMVGRKLSAALEQGISPILCVGESRAERDLGRTHEVIDRQVRSAMSLLPAEESARKPLVYIAYEPVWAISTSQETQSAAAQVSEVESVIHYMQGITRGLPIAPLFLYGGSVDAKTIGGFLGSHDIAGALVGGASIRPGEFKKMIAEAKQYH